MLKKDRNFKINRSQAIVIGFLLILGGVWFFSKTYIGTVKDELFQEENMRLFEGSEYSEEVTLDETPEQEVEEKSETQASTEVSVNQTPTNQTATKNSNTNAFIGVLEIPKIGLKRGFVDMNSSQNTISRNITIIPGSTYPDVANGNFIIAGHSGRGSIAFFKNLYQLTEGDYAYISYQSVKYTYKIVKIYEQEKTGTAKIYRDTTKTTLTLITCTKDNDYKQTIYIAELVDQK